MKKKQDIEAEIEFFNKLAEESSHFDTISKKVYLKIFSTVMPFIKRRILEAGCGTGSFGKRIKYEKKEVEIYGIDLSDKFVKIAKNSNVYNDVICESVENTDIYSHDYFDVIICPYILHHLPAMERAIKNFYFWLKPGGYLIIVDPNGSNLALKLSYWLRIFLSKFADIRKYASINEAHKSKREFKKHLSRYKLIKIETFEQEKATKNGELSVMFILGKSREILLKIYNFISFGKNKSDLIIIAQKNEKD